MARDLIVTEARVRKVIETVDKGLSHGLGIQKPGEMCVEAAVCYAFDLPHGDNPGCVSETVRKFKIKLNDSEWSSKAARAKGMRKLAVAQLGTSTSFDNTYFAKELATFTIKTIVPIALRALLTFSSLSAHHPAISAAIELCVKDGNKAAANAANNVAYAAANVAYAAAYAAANVAYAAANAANKVAYAAANAANSAANAAANAAYAAANAANNVAANAANNAAANAAAYVANSAAYAAYAADKLDEILGILADGATQILIDMNTPGSKFLWLCE